MMNANEERTGDGERQARRSKGDGQERTVGRIDKSAKSSGD